MKTQDLEYREGDKPLRGFLAWDEKRPDPRPGVLVVHDNAGLGDHDKERARRLAELGYVALACDMFGERSSTPMDDAQRRQAFEEFRTKKLLPRAQASLAALAAQPQVDQSRLAAIGFCFGGMTVLELARAGAELRGVVSFHGGLTAGIPAEPNKIKSKILVCHGALDPYVTMEHVSAFIGEMNAAKADWQVIVYSGAVHGFTNSTITRPVPGVAYHEPSDVRSWAATRQFLSELFGASES